MNNSQSTPWVCVRSLASMLGLIPLSGKELAQVVEPSEVAKIVLKSSGSQSTKSSSDETMSKIEF